MYDFFPEQTTFPSEVHRREYRATKCAIDRLGEAGFDGSVSSIPGLHVPVLPHYPINLPPCTIETLPQTRIVELVGPSGSGKTTTFKLLFGLTKEVTGLCPFVSWGDDIVRRYDVLTRLVREYGNHRASEYIFYHRVIVADMLFEAIRAKLGVSATPEIVGPKRLHSNMIDKVHALLVTLVNKRGKEANLVRLRNEIGVIPGNDLGNILRVLTYVGADVRTVTIEAQFHLHPLLLFLLPEIPFEDYIDETRQATAQIAADIWWPQILELMHMRNLDWFHVALINEITDGTKPIFLDEGMTTTWAFQLALFQQGLLDSFIPPNPRGKQEETLRQVLELSTSLRRPAMPDTALFLFIDPRESERRDSKVGPVKNTTMHWARYYQYLRLYSEALFGCPDNGYNGNQRPQFVVGIDASGTQSETVERVKAAVISVQQIINDHRLKHAQEAYSMPFL